MVKQPRKRDLAWHPTHSVGGMDSRLAEQGLYTQCPPTGGQPPPPGRERLLTAADKVLLAPGAAAKNFTTTYANAILGSSVQLKSLLSSVVLAVTIWGFSELMSGFTSGAEPPDPQFELAAAVELILDGIAARLEAARPDAARTG